MSCGKPIRVNRAARLGEARYVHDPAIASSHVAVRGPDDPKYMPGHYDGDGCVFPDAGHFAGREPR